MRLVSRCTFPGALIFAFALVACSKNTGAPDGVRPIPVVVPSGVPIRAEASSPAHLDRQVARLDCQQISPGGVAEYHDRMKAKQFYAAAAAIRFCASSGDPKSVELLRNAEVQYYVTEINDAHSSAARRAEVLEKFFVEYPEEARKHIAQLGHLKAKAAQDVAREAKSRGASIGMSKNEVLASSWGKPRTVNRTVTASGIREQWVYSGGYLYFEDGVLVAIQN